MRVPAILGVAAWIVLLPASLHPQAAIPDAEFVKRAQTGAPKSISADAAVARIEKDGKITSLREGKNGFTCSLLADGGDSPVCADDAGWKFLSSAFTKQPKPTNTKPGIAYMMQGGKHWESSDGRIVMGPEENAKMANEPPHWMLLWNFDQAESGLPSHPTPQGTYIMFAGTPYSHLMIYQNPASLKLGSKGM
jgi:hypothetical protein